MQRRYCNNGIRLHVVETAGNELGIGARHQLRKSGCNPDVWGADMSPVKSGGSPSNSSSRMTGNLHLIAALDNCTSTRKHFKRKRNMLCLTAIQALFIAHKMRGL